MATSVTTWERDFFLWGSRQTGKSTLLRATYPDALWIALLKASIVATCRTLQLLRPELAVSEPVRQEVITVNVSPQRVSANRCK